MDDRDDSPLTGTRPIRRHVVVLDESRAVLISMRRMLEQRGFQASCFMRARDIERDVLERASLILLDPNLPEVSRGDVIAYWKTELRLTAPVLLMSSLSESELEERVKRTRADGYVSKGIGLLNQLDRYLSSRGRRTAR